MASDILKRGTHPGVLAIGGLGWQVRRLLRVGQQRGRWMAEARMADDGSVVCGGYWRSRRCSLGDQRWPAEAGGWSGSNTAGERMSEIHRWRMVRGFVMCAVVRIVVCR